jgi:hypothetical protein
LYRQAEAEPVIKGLRCLAGGVAGLALLLAAGTAAAQAPATAGANQEPLAQVTVPEGYSSHQTIDVGGHASSITGSQAMYSTMVNQQSGPRVLGHTFEMHALPGNKHTWVDSLSASDAGFGGDPYDFAKLNFAKGKLYEFSGLFRRNRQYFDYDLLGNPNIADGRSIPIGPSTAPTGSLVWPRVNQSAETFNTVRRMTDTDVRILPLEKFSFTAGYSQNIFQGPTLSPSYSILTYDALLQQYQRNSTDDFRGSIIWKPVERTTIEFAEQVTHYKGDSYFTLNPRGNLVQEADGTPVYLGNWDSQTAYGISACNTASMGSAYTSSSNYTLLSSNATGGTRPIINAACSVVTRYTRTQPTRILTPTETLRLQSSSIKNIAMNGQISYTRANMNMPSYYENVQGLGVGSTTAGAVRSKTTTGSGTAHRDVLAADYAIAWQAGKAVTLTDTVRYNLVQQPGQATFQQPTTLLTPLPSTGNATLNYTGTLTSGTASTIGGTTVGTAYDYYGQKLISNDVTASWDATSRLMMSLTYRFKSQRFTEGLPQNVPLVVNATTEGFNGYVDVTQNGGVFSAVYRPTNNLDINGSVEIAYADNAFTSVSPRQFKQYRLHSRFRPTSWAKLGVSYNDVERHNNTNNNSGDVADGEALYEGPLNHVDYNRAFGLNASITPSELYSIDFQYGYTHVYTATNVCFTSGAASNLAGVATTKADGTPAVCPGVYARGSTTTLVDWFARSYTDAPTQFGSVALSVNPIKPVHANLGYTVSSVDGSQFFLDPRMVNGSLASTYQSPFVKLDWQLRPGLSWKAEYNFFGYGEGGVSGAVNCSTSTSLTATIVPCADMSLSTARNAATPAGYTAPRNFHANNVTLALHYEF